MPDAGADTFGVGYSLLMRHLHLAPAVLVLLGSALLLSACNSSAPGDNGTDMSASPDGGTVGKPDLRFDSDAFFAKDPPLMYCGLDGGTFPPPKVPGGTPDCPDDKNREGCPCDTVGTQAPCWPGLRKNRMLGICKDGIATCVQSSEIQSTWGACQGYVLPVEGGTGKDACDCFSGGRWAIKNLVPCFYAFGNTNYGSGGTASSILHGDGTTTCQDFGGGPIMKPSQDWSPDTVTVDCEGHFKLCYALKAGDGKAPKVTDCTIAEVCSEADYTQVNMAQTFPPLKAFAADSSSSETCAVQFVKTGGYGEMRVDGTSITCDKVVKVFNRVTYCPLDCKPGDPRAQCQNCMAGGSGNF